MKEMTLLSLVCHDVLLQRSYSVIKLQSDSSRLAVDHLSVRL